MVIKDTFVPEAIFVDQSEFHCKEYDWLRHCVSFKLIFEGNDLFIV